MREWCDVESVEDGGFLDEGDEQETGASRVCVSSSMICFDPMRIWDALFVIIVAPASLEL